MCLILKRNFCFDINGRFGTTWVVTLYCINYKLWPRGGFYILDVDVWTEIIEKGQDIPKSFETKSTEFVYKYGGGRLKIPKSCARPWVKFNNGNLSLSPTETAGDRQPRGNRSHPWPAWHRPGDPAREPGGGAGMYRDRLKSMQILLSRTQAGPGRAVKQEQKQTSCNHVQNLQSISVESEHLFRRTKKTVLNATDYLNDVTWRLDDNRKRRKHRSLPEKCSYDKYRRDLRQGIK